MADYALAEAFVSIRPDTTGFRAEATTKIKAALTGLNPEVTVKVGVDVSHLKAALKGALASALGGAGGGKLPVKLQVEADPGEIARQIAILKARMAQQGLADFLDADLPIGKIQYQISLMRRLLQQGKVTDFLGVSLNPGQVLGQGKVLEDALNRELSDISIGVSLSAGDLAAQEAALKAAAKAALGGITIPVTEQATGGVTPGGPEVGVGPSVDMNTAPTAQASATALLALAAASTKAGDAAKYAYAANIAENIAIKQTGDLAAPVADAVNTMAGRWGVLTNKVQLFGGVLAGVPIVAQVALWHILLDSIIEFAAVLIPATVALVAFGAAGAPTVQHIFVQMSNLWTTTQALGQSIYPITKQMMGLGDAVKPEIYTLFGEALVVINAKAGEFSKVAAAAGQAMDQLGARAAAALVSGGFSQFIKNGPADLAKIGDIIGNISGTIGNLLKTLPGYAGDLLNFFDAVTRAMEAVTANPVAQWFIGLGLALHGAILYGGLAVTAFVLIGNALGGLAAKFGIADAAALSFDASLFSVGVGGMITGLKEIGASLVALVVGQDAAAAAATEMALTEGVVGAVSYATAAGEDVAAASADALAVSEGLAAGATDLLAGALAVLEAVNPLVWVGAAIAAIVGLVYWLGHAASATQTYDDAVKGALSQAPVNQLGLDLTREMASTIGNLADAQANLGTVTKNTTTEVGKFAQPQQVLTQQYQQQTAAIAGYKQELGTLQGYQANYNTLVKAAGGNLALLNLAGITSNQIMGASKSQMAQNIILVQAQVAQFKAMQLGVGRAGAAMNALNYTGDTTNNMLGSLDVDMTKIVQGQDALSGVILGGEQAFIGFNQAIIQWGTDLGRGPKFLDALTGSTTKALTAQSDFYNTVLPGAQKLIDALEMQLAPTQQISNATATSAKEMLALAGNNQTARGVIISFINNALGPGTVGFQNLNSWVAKNSVSQQGFQSIIAQSTINAAKLGGTIQQLTQDYFEQDLMVSAHVTPDMKALTNSIVNNGSESDATRAARQRLIDDYEKTGLTAQQATKLVDGLSQGIINVPAGKTTTLTLKGVGTIALKASGAYIQGESGHIQAYAAGTSGAAAGWGVVGENGPELVKFKGGEQVVSNARLPMYAGGTPGADLIWMQDTAASMAGRFDTGAADVFANAFSKAVGNASAGLGNYKAGAGVQQWAGVAAQAINLAHALAPVSQVLYQMQTESGGNPYAVNKTDINWQLGHPSVGLLQVIQGTFDAFAGPYVHTGPFAYGVSENPLANIYAAIKYAEAVYGPTLMANGNGLGSGHGYDNGGWLMPGTTLAHNNTGQPEWVSPPAAKLKRAGTPPPPTVSLEIRSTGVSDFDKFMTSWLHKAVVIKGGGSVQVAFGASNGT